MTLRPPEIRQPNAVRVLSEIRRNPGISRRQLSRQINSTDASLSRIAKGLIQSRMVFERDEVGDANARGRPGIGLFINPTGILLLAVIVRPDEWGYSVVDMGMGRHLSGTVAMPQGGRPPDYSDITDQIDADLRGRLDVPGADGNRIAAVNIAVAPSYGHLPIVEQSKLRDAFAARFATPVNICTTQSALHLAEARHFAERSLTPTVLIDAGKQVSGSLLVGHETASPTHFEDLLGHVPVPAWPDGDACTLSDIASTSAILRTLGSGAADARLGSDGGYAVAFAVRQANAGDRRAIAAFREAGEALGAAVASVVVLLGPKKVFLSGPLAQAAPYFAGFSAVIAASCVRSDPRAADIVQRSTINAQQAAEASGLEHFVYSA